MLEKANEYDMEMGNLLFGNARGEYMVPREWQDEFVDFLNSNGFDFDGYIEDNALNRGRREERLMDECLEWSPMSAEYVKENGTLVKEEDGIPYYDLDGQRYCICKELSDEYLDRESEFYDKLLDMLPGESLEEDDGELEALMLRHEADLPVATESDYFDKTYLVRKKEFSAFCFNNGTFIVRPYYWGDSEEIGKLPNFEYLPGKFELSWYKHPLRDSYCNKDITWEAFREMLKACSESIAAMKKDKED